MPIRCGKNGCLRATPVEGQPCKSCAIGGKPLTNPKNPRAIKEINVTNAPKITPTGVTITDASGKVVDVAVLAESNKKACEFIFRTYWYGWENGCPPILHEMFKDYGTFTAGQPASSGQSKINVHSSVQWKMQEMLYAGERKSDGPAKAYAQLKQRIEASPILREKTEDVTVEDLTEMVRNHGKNFDFSKQRGTGMWIYEDPTGTVRQIPKWAIT